MKPSINRPSVVKRIIRYILTKTYIPVIAGILVVSSIVGYFRLNHTSQPDDGEIQEPASFQPKKPTVASIRHPEPVPDSKGMDIASKPDSHSRPSPDAPSLSLQPQAEVPDQGREAIIRQIETFKSNALRETHATRIRLETPQLRAVAKSGVDPADPPASGEEATRDAPEVAPGYVAFMIDPEGMSEGVYHSMEKIAWQYFDTFPAAHRVTVSLIIGGGVKDRETFFNNGDGSVRMNEQ